MGNRRLLRTIVTIFGVLVLMAAAALFIVWKELPDLRTFLARVGWIQEPVVSAAAPAQEPTPAPARAPSSVATPAPQVVSPPPASADVLSYLVDRFGSSIDLGVCENLAQTQGPAAASTGGFAEALMRQASGDAPVTPLIESTLAPMALFIRQPGVARLISRIQAVQSGGDFDLLTGNDFNSDISAASAEALTNRAAMELAAQHAYHLYVIARAAQVNPRLANDERALSICSRIEELTEQTPTQQVDPIRMLEDLDREKADILRFLAEVGLAPEQVGYDPNLRNQIRTEIRSTSLSLTIPWMSQAFGARFEIPVPRAR